MHILLIEPDRVVADCIIKAFLEKGDFTFSLAVTGDGAIIKADLEKPDVVISELMLAGHSGTEFLYEFRTYSDWEDVPIIIFTSLPVDANIFDSNDWKKLNISNALYKPRTSISELREAVLDAVLVG